MNDKTSRIKKINIKFIDKYRVLFTLICYLSLMDNKFIINRLVNILN